MGAAQPTRDTLAEGLVGLVRPSLESLDESVAATREAQAQLKDKIQSLENQLVQLQASVNRNQSGVNLEAYINKLTSSKKRILVVNSILQGAQVHTTYLLLQVPQAFGLAIFSPSPTYEYAEKLSFSLEF